MAARRDKDGTIQSFDAASGKLVIHCRGCDDFHEYHVSELRAHGLDKHRSQWSIALPPCPCCNSRVYGGASPCPFCTIEAQHYHAHDVHLNCNLPPDHPHPSAGVIERIIAALMKQAR